MIKGFKSIRMILTIFTAVIMLVLTACASNPASTSQSTSSAPPLDNPVIVQVQVYLITYSGGLGGR